MRSRWILLVALVCILTSLSHSTLSKSDNEKKKSKKGERSSNDHANLLEVVKSDQFRKDILETHSQFDTSEPKRNFVKLGYVTPWNGHGYDVAKWTAHKFTHISPVWFQLHPAKIDGRISCEFKGQHDIDRGWLEDLRKNNSEIKIVPRFIFESASVELFQNFISSETAQMFCADELVAFLQQNQFDGAVFEFWLQILVNTQGQAMDYLIEMTEIFGKRLHLKEMEYIVPLTPAQQNMNPNERTYLPPNVIPRLFKAVDYLQLMSYDFNGNDAEGNAPLPWIRNNVHLLLFDNPQYASKVLIGLNYYGRCKGSSNDAILGNKFIELLNDPEFEMYWDEAVNENFIANDENKCYFPTLQSINDRLNFVQDENLAGVAIWETGQGLNHFSSIL